MHTCRQREEKYSYVYSLLACALMYVVVSTYAGEKEGWKKKAQVMEEKELRLLPAECT